METSLHRQLKDHYAALAAAGRRAESKPQLEVRLGNYRIDVVNGNELIEIQIGSLAALRKKVQALLADNRVRVVKPLVQHKQLVNFDAPGGTIKSRRASPKKCHVLSLFDELVYFTSVFPHPRLALDFWLVEIEEWRCPGHGRRRRWRSKDHVVIDQRLVAVADRFTLRTAADLAGVVRASIAGAGLPEVFDTSDLAGGLGVDRWIAQRIAYCLRHTGAVEEAGKRANARLYRWPAGRRRRRAG